MKDKISEIKDAERKALESIEAASARKDREIRNRQLSAAEELRSAEKEEKTKAEKVLSEGIENVRSEVGVSMKQREKEIETLRKSGSRNVDKAADFIADYILNRLGTEG